MPSLLELQRDFSAALLGGDPAPAAARVLDDRLPAAARLQVYRNHVRISLREALGATFPVVLRLVGPAYFAAAAKRFIETSPPAGPVLAEYGAGFPDFLDRAPNAPPYLGDVARLEWALNAAYHAADTPALAAQHLARLEPERYAALRLTPLPSARLVASPHPIQSIWRANQPDRDGTPEGQLGAETVLAWRAADGDAACRVLEDGEAAFYRAVFDGAALSDALAAAIAVRRSFDLSAAIAGALAEPIFCAPGDTP